MPESRQEAEVPSTRTSLKFSTSSAAPHQLDLMTRRRPVEKAGPAPATPLPIMRVTPVYPSRASRRGIEGWAEVAFTINTNGATENIRVVGEDPPGVFGRATMKAVRKWKYKPQVIDGKVQPRPNVRVMLKFELEK